MQWSLLATAVVPSLGYAGVYCEHDSLNLQRMVPKLLRDHAHVFSDVGSAEAAIVSYTDMLCRILAGDFGSPSQQVDAVWHEHILDTEAYHQDTLRMFGSYLHHKPFAEIDVHSEPFFMDKRTVFGEKLNPLHLDLSRFADRLQQQQPQSFPTEILAQEAIDEYKRMLYLIQQDPTEPAAPSKLVDLVWHEHILDTVAYAEDTQQMFGFYLHHNPCAPGAPNEAQQEAQNRAEQKGMLERYRSVFGGEPDASLWPAVNASASDKIESPCGPITPLNWNTIHVNGLCLDVPGGHAENGQSIWLWECGGGFTQNWYVEHRPDGRSIHYGATKDTPGKFCLDAHDMSEGSLLSLWECNGLPQQQWFFDGDGPKFSRPFGIPYQGGIGLSTGMCMDGFSPLQQTNSVGIWACNGNEQQVWSMCSSYYKPCYPPPCNPLQESNCQVPHYEIM